MTTATTTRPPSSNTGANSGLRTHSLTLKLASDLHFDWYDATIRPAPSADSVCSVLGSAVVGAAGRWKAVRGVNGYGFGVQLEGVQQGSVTVYSGGSAEMGLHVKSTSSASVPVAAALRHWWPDHLVSRADVALDFDFAGSFDALWPLLDRLATEGGREGRRVGTRTEGDWLHEVGGRTLYVGGRKSRGLVCCYQKGHEQTAKDPTCGASLDWTRVEWRVRPDGPAKSWAARASEVELVGMTAYGAALAEALVQAQVPTMTAVRKYGSQDPLYWMVRQYRRHVERLLEMPPDELHEMLVQLVASATTTGPA